MPELKASGGETIKPFRAIRAVFLESQQMGKKYGVKGVSEEILQTIGKTCPNCPTQATDLSLSDGLLLNTGFRDPLARFIRTTFVIAHGAGISEDALWSLYRQWHADQSPLRAAPQLSRWNLLFGTHEALRGTAAMRSPSVVVDPLLPPVPGFRNLVVRTAAPANVTAFNPRRKANNT